MGLFTLFSKPEEGDDPSRLRDRERILAYLEELARIRAVLHVHLRGRDSEPVLAKLDVVRDNPPGLTLAFQQEPTGCPEPGQEVTMTFLLDGMRLEAPLKLAQKPGGSAVLFELPASVRHAERRSAPRARFTSREKATVTVLEGLFDGIGAAGRLVNLSAGGLCVALERAIAIKGDRKLGLSSSLFPVGVQLPIVRIQNLPQAPMLEASGVAAYLVDGPEGVCLGLRLKGLGTPETQILAQVLGKRVVPLSSTFPIRSRRKEPDAEDAPVRRGPSPEMSSPSPGRAGLGSPVQASLPAASPASGAAPDVPHARAATSGPATRETSGQELPGSGRPPSPPPQEAQGEDGRVMDVRLLVKKRTKRLLLLMLDDLDRALLAGTLHVDGYRHVAEARNFMEALKSVQALNPDVILIDQQIGIHSAQQFMDKLRLQGGCHDTPVVMLAETLDVKATLMARAARFAHVQRKPLDYDGELKDVLARLLKIDT